MTDRSHGRRVARLAVVALLGGLAAGCGTMIPTYVRPAAPIPAAYPGEGVDTRTPQAAEIDWHDYFADARLKRLIEIALANNRDLRVAALNIEQARALYQVRRANELPTVGAGVNAARQANGAGGVGNVYSAGIAVPSYELDFFGRVRSLSAVALAQYLATTEARKTVQIGLVAGVANSYLNLLADDETLGVTRQTLATREESYKLTQLKYEHGVASELDSRQALSLLEAARVTLAAALRQRALDQHALVLLLGQALPADLPASLPLSQRQLMTDLPAGLPSALLQRRPDLLAAEQQLIAANANIGAARAAFFPQITLTGNAGSASTALSGLFQSGTFAITGTAQLLQPLFDAGRNRANLEAVTAARAIAVAQYEKAIQVAFREVSDALAGRETLGDQVQAQRAQVEALQRAYDLADLRYRNGASSYLDALDAQRSLFAAQQAAIQVRAAQVQNLVTLYQVLGGGWSEAPAAPVTAPVAAR